MFSMSRRSRSADHCAIFPNLSDNVIAVVATMGTEAKLLLSSDPDESAPGDPGRFFRGAPSFFTLASIGCFVTTFSPGFVPAFGDTGFGGGGLVLGSVGRSVLVGLGMRLAIGGVIGRGILRGGGDDGLGGRGRDEVGFEDGGFR